MLRKIAETINDYDGIGIALRSRYIGQKSPLAPYIFAELRQRHGETCLNGGLAKERGHRDLSGQCRLGKEVEVAFDTEISNRSGKIQAVNGRLV